MQAFENHSHWNAVKEACLILRQAGYQALLAGGCVRDLLMGREPHDFDIATDATPDEVEALFPKSLAVGKAFGVMILPCDGFQIEIATFREDLEYKDGRRPEGVKFSSPEADAKRRDFTVNALFLDLESSKVIDFVGGEADIQRRVIRTVGEPARRFGEDKLRLLRAVRFAAQLEFTIAPETLSAVEALAPEIQVVSRERVRDELLKLMKQPARLKGLRLLVETGLLRELFPRIHSCIEENLSLWLKSFEYLHGLEAEVRTPVLLWALFMRPAYESDEKVVRETELKDLRLDNKVIDAIVFSLRALPVLLAPEKERRGELALRLLHPYAREAEALASMMERALVDADARESMVPTEREAALEIFKRDAFGENGERAVAWLTGADAKNAGIMPGPRLGKILREAHLLQLEGVLKDREAALEWLSAQEK